MANKLLGDAPDQEHYEALGEHQPLRVVQCWSVTWPKAIVYNLAESLYMIARCGTRRQTIRDLRKAWFLIGDAIERLEKAKEQQGEEPK